MRSIAIAAVLVFLAVPSANAEYLDGDNYLACLVGQGSVLVARHDYKAHDALDLVLGQCESTMEPEPSAEPEGEWGDYVDYVYGVALEALAAIEAAKPY